MKILIIAPYPNLKKKVDKICQNASYKEIKIDCFVGDLEKGLKIAVELNEDYDVIISRGGTAELIKASSNIPLVEIDISILDILRIIKLVENYEEKFVFIGYTSITAQVKLLSEILDKQLDIITIKNKKEVPSVIDRVKRNAYSLIIGDNITTKVALEKEINSILIESGDESISAAINDAILLGSIIQKGSERNNFAKNIIEADDLSFFILDKNKELVYCNHTEVSKNKLKLILKIINEEKTIPRKKKIRYRTIYGNQFSIDSIFKDNFYYFIFHKLEFTEFNNFYFKENTDITVSSNSSILVGEEIKEMRRLLAERPNLLIYGENGTGKKSLKKYLLNRKQTEKCWTLDFSKEISDEEWKALLNSYDSILLETNSTFFILAINDQQLKKLKELINFINFTSYLNNQWIFIVSTSEPVKDSLSLISSQLWVSLIPLSPLRERSSDLNSILSIYLYENNARIDKNIIGFEPAALQLMKDYTWPGNLAELRSAIYEMSINSNNTIISYKTVNDYMEKIKNRDKIINNDSINFENKIKEMTLEDIKQLAIKMVLSANNGNQTKTAESLQISRSTLWRYLK